jgi:hypothetical protein
MNNKIMSVKYLAVLLLGIVILLLVSFDAFSQSETSLNQGDVFTLTSSKEILRPVVTYEEQPSTCTREVYTGTHEVCSGGRTETRCRKVSGVGPECWEETTGETCTNEDTYSTETYSCMETVAVTNYVHDHNVSLNVDAVKTLRSTHYDLSKCTLGVSVEDTSESFFAKCMEAIIRVNVVSRNEVMNGEDKVRTMKVDVDFAPIDDLSAVKYGLENLNYAKGFATFKTADLSTATNFRLRAKLTRNRFLLKDKVVLDRELKAQDYKIELVGNGQAVIKVELAKLVSDFNPKYKHTLKIDLSTIKTVDVKGALNTPGLTNSLSATTVINE